MRRQTQIWITLPEVALERRHESTLCHFLFVDRSMALYPSFETGG